jgi:alpha,alpha-trehalase
MDAKKLRVALFEHFSKCKWLVKKPASAYIKHDYLVPCGPYEEQWDWDGFFIGSALSRVIHSEAIYLKNWTLNYLENVHANGFTPGLLTPMGPDKRLKHIKPFLAQGASLASWYLKDYAWLRRHWPKLKKSLAYRMHANMNRKFGLASWYDSMESGADNNPAVWGFKNNSVVAVDLNTYLYMELTAMAEMATKFRDFKHAKRYKHQAKELKEKMLSYLWNAEDECFYNLNTLTGQHIKKKSFACFLPLYKKLVTEKMGKRIIERHVLNPREFWSKYGVRSLAKDEIEYNNANIIKPHSNWQGPVWPLVNFFTFRALLNYGFKKQAKELAIKTGKILLNDIRLTGGMHENYHAETGKPLAAPNFVSWNLLASSMLQKASEL